MERTLQRLAVGLLVVATMTAGCQAPAADAGNDGLESPAPSENETGDRLNSESAPNVTVLNGSLELDPGKVFARVQRVSDTNVTAPAAVRVFGTSEEFYSSTPGGLGPNTLPRFWHVAGLETESVNGSALEFRKNGYVTGTGAVTIYLGENATVADERLVLAHEFTHYVQLQTGRQTDLNGAVGGRTTDSAYVSRAIVEGGAVLTTDAYVREYAPGEQLNSPWYDEIQATYPAGHVGQFQNGRYVHGHDYAATRLDSPTALPEVYENPPQTSEQLLHGLTPNEEPPTDLAVDTTTGDDWVASGTDRMGEAFVRYALASDVGTERATRAAAGWGNDSLHIFRPVDGGTASYVWVLDWDDPANASEFEQTLRSALDARGDSEGGVWSLSDADAAVTVAEVDGATTAVVFGSESFVAGTTVTGTTDTVTIEAG
ncbi:hypothetical protein [Salinibaculum rarum]|uniref:hypothetical protein n=1 Tax=Salinibaculum rarum TaxID=3058903 RepID=UPI00265F8B5A|nr:hypothetical protein [Salinibaculum sp. KK48]